MAPDKIYMPNELLSEEWQRHIEGEDTAYVRKNALLEWAKKENLKFNQIGNDQDDNFARGVAAGFGYLISKLGSL